MSLEKNVEVKKKKKKKERDGKRREWNGVQGEERMEWGTG